MNHSFCLLTLDAERSFDCGEDCLARNRREQIIEQLDVLFIDHLQIVRQFDEPRNFPDRLAKRLFDPHRAEVPERESRQLDGPGNISALRVISRDSERLQDDVL